LARLNLTRSRIFGLGIATAAFAACGHSGTTPSATPTATPSSIVSTSPSSPPCILSLGIAYEPDAGNGNGLDGIQVTHYEGNSEYLCAAVTYSATPPPVRFSSSVGEFAISGAGTDGVDDAVAIVQNTSGSYSLVQDVFGATAGPLVPAGAPYDASLQPPTPVPTGSGTAAPASAQPVIPDISSVTTINGGSSGVALLVGPAAAPPAIVAVTSLENAPPQFGESVLYNEPYAHLPSPAPFPRSIIRVDSATTTSGTTTLVRGQYDLLSYAVTTSGIGFQFNLEAQDTNLGTGIPMRGNGNIAFDPSDGSRALIGGTTAGGQGVLTLVSGLPDAITELSTLTLPAAIHSIVISGNGLFALVGTDAGIVVVTSIDGTTLSTVTPFDPSPLSALANAIPYTSCTGVATKMTKVYSVGFAPNTVPGSTTATYIVALGTASGVACPSGYNASLVAVAFDTTLGATPAPSATPTATATPTPAPVASGATPTPVPTASPTPPPVFVQNNVIAPPTGADLLVVK
jgi:hypothetical protein